MLCKKMKSLKKLAKKVKIIGGDDYYHYENLLREFEECDAKSSPSYTPTGYFAVYVGEERERFAVPTGFLSHPLFKMLLEKSQDEFGFEQSNGLVVPCSVATFKEVVHAVQCCRGKFDFGNLVKEFV